MAGHELNLEIFVAKQLDVIQSQASGRSSEHAALRQGCQQLKDLFRGADFGRAGSRISVPLSPEVSVPLLAVVRSALTTGSPKIAEPALAALHKLVAYAYLQGETRPSGRLDDADSRVTQVVVMTVRCADNASPSVQLAVIKALLTLATAEHFVPHGDTLMMAVRATFNIAVGGATEDLRTTARSALLQMVNTIVKRVAHQIITPLGTPLVSRAPSHETATASQHAAAAPIAETTPQHEPTKTTTTATTAEQNETETEICTTTVAGLGHRHQYVDTPNQAIQQPDDEPSHPPPPPQQQQRSPQNLPKLKVRLPQPQEDDEIQPSSEYCESEAAAMSAAAAQQQHLADTRTAKLASLAERADLRALERALDALPLQDTDGTHGTGMATPPLTSDAARSLIDPGAKGQRQAATFAVPTSVSEFGKAAADAVAAVAQRASAATVFGNDASSERQPQGNLDNGANSTCQEPTDSRDVAGNTTAARATGGQTGLVGASHQPGSPLRRVDTPPDPRRALMRERRAAEWRRLTVAEKDAATVLAAMCKMAARETGGANAEPHIYAGKLLALDILVGVLTHPSHDWSQVRPQFAAQLRQPMCLALLRNCGSSSNAAVIASVRILSAILASQRLREGLKDEVGALYPLLLLRPLELERQDVSTQALSALEGLRAIASSPQVLVDVFINFDCSLQAANLFERSIKALARYAAPPSAANTAGKAALASAAKARGVALSALLAVVKSLDTWTGPLKAYSDGGFGNTETPPHSVTKGSDFFPEGTTGMTSSSKDKTGAAEGKVVGDVIGGSGLPHGSHPRTLYHEVLERLHTDKALKESLADGIAVFNTNPVKGLAALNETGVLSSDDPMAVVGFLRKSADVLDATAVGELLGHHGEEAIKIMHAYIDTEPSFSGLTLDVALRRLLSTFRLPGEAQKIDRIVEKFAQRYCDDNPNVFPAADAAYLLSFAIIMLNTDAHNPMADARIGSEEFVTMCMYQCEATGGYKQILSTEELLQLYDRIKAEELALSSSSQRPDGARDAAGMPRTDKDAAKAAAKYKNNSGNGRRNNDDGNVHSGEAQSRRARLAAALGLSQLAAPFWAGATWDKQHGVDVERRRLLELTGKFLAQTPGGASSPIALWHTATHAEHARPMLQVGGEAIAKSLAGALETATSVAAVSPVLEAYSQAVQLAALLRLESLCEVLVSDLAGAAGLRRPALPRSAEEARQVAALSRLIWLGSCSDAGLLGSAWIVLLRALSDLESLRTRLTSPDAEGLHDGADSATSSSSSISRFFGKMSFGFGGNPASAVPSAPQLTASYAAHGASGAGGGITNAGGASSVPSSGTASARRSSVTLAVHEAPGMGAVLWAETAGASPIDRIFANSASLDGDAVLTFFRALCAVSQGELDPGTPGAPPRVHLLQRLVECTYLNTDRIRLVWQRLWTVVSQHLVSAACHSDPYVAMYAVDALRQLSDKLLCRAELAGFATQGEALRPMAAVLRGSDSAAVRELAAACVAHAVEAHRKRIGSGWRAVVDALAVAASDPSPAVVTQSLDAMAAVFAALYAQDGGHACLRECVAAALTAVVNPGPEVAGLGLSALLMFQTLARRLAEASCCSSSTSSSSVGGLGLGLGVEVGGAFDQKQQRHAQQRLTLAQPQQLADGLGDGVGVGVDRAPSAENSTELMTRKSSLQAALPSARAAAAGVDGGVLYDAWCSILCPLAAVARSDQRQKEANAAASVLFQTLLQTPEDALPPSLWQDLFIASVLPLLSLSGNVVLPLSPPASAVRRRMLVSPSALPMPSAEVLSPEGASRVMRHAATHLPDIWTLLGGGGALGGRGAPETPSSSLSGLQAGLGNAAPSTRMQREAETHQSRRAAVLLRPVLALLRSYVESSDAQASAMGTEQLHVMLREIGPVLQPDGWKEVRAVLSEMVGASTRALTTGEVRLRMKQKSGNDFSEDATDSADIRAAKDMQKQQQQQQQQQPPDLGTVEQQTHNDELAQDFVRRACRTTVMAIRCVGELLERSAAAMPAEVQLGLLSALKESVAFATALNTSLESRKHLAARLGYLGSSSDDTVSRHLNAGDQKRDVWHRSNDIEIQEHQENLESENGDDQLPSSSTKASSAAAAATRYPTATAIADMVVHWDAQPLPALTRQETEGGRVLIAALRRRALRPTALDATGIAELQNACRRELVEVVMTIVHAAAEPLTNHAASAVAGEEVAAGTHPAPSGMHPRDELALRASIVRDALLALSVLPLEAWESRKTEALSVAARLVCCADLGVRQAVQELMRKQGAAVFGGAAPPRDE